VFFNSVKFIVLKILEDKIDMFAITAFVVYFFHLFIKISLSSNV